MNQVQHHSLPTGIVDNGAALEVSQQPAWVLAIARSWRRALWIALPVLALFALFVTTGLRGVDYGWHWDEGDWHIKPSRQMVETGILLPKSYIYPSFDKWLVLIPSVVRGIQTA